MDYYEIWRKLRIVLALVLVMAASCVGFFWLTAPPSGVYFLNLDGSWSGRSDPSAVTTCAEETARQALEDGAVLQVAPVSDPAHSSRWRGVDSQLNLWDRMKTGLIAKFKRDKVQEVMNQVDAVMKSPEPLPNASDVLSATWTASRHIATLRPNPDQRADVKLVICSDASTVSRDLDVYRDDLSSKAVQSVLADRRKNGDLADLRGVTVIFGAAGRDPRLDPDRAGPVQRLWTVDFKVASQATDVIYDSVPHFPTSRGSNAD